MTTDKKLGLQNITWKATLLYGSEPWTVKNKGTQDTDVT